MCLQADGRFVDSQRRAFAHQTGRDIVGARLGILVANAGVNKAASIADTTIRDFDALFAMNVRAPFFLVQPLLPVMGDGSTVVLVSSLAAHSAAGFAAHAATKAAIDT